MQEQRAPGNSDITIRAIQRGDRTVYVLARFGGDDQYLVQSREEALRQACTIAQQVGARVWLDEGSGFELIHAAHA